MFVARCVLCLVAMAAAAVGAPPAPASAPNREQLPASTAVIDGSIQVPGLHQQVRVQRDRWGVAHIYASDQHDLFFAQGFVTAQDRLFQMELWKRAGQGRLAEILGPMAVQRDINARRLRYRGDMLQEYRSYASDTLAILQAFTAGINAYIEASRRAGRSRLPVEFRLAGFEPEPWKPEDCLNRLAAYAMMGNASDELLHAQLVSLLGPSRAAELVRFDPAARLDAAPGLDLSGLSPALLDDIVGSDRRIPFPATSLQESNNWTISGALTASGRPLLANDPHRVIAQPSLRYIVHLVAPGWNVIGAVEPALPGVAAGHNEHIAWGFTIFGLDQQDLYIERLNPADAGLYQGAHGWSALREERVTIRVRGGADVPAVLHFTQHGPVVWEDGRRAVALRWVGAEPGTAGYLGALSVDRARNWQEFERAMPRWKVPPENIVYADDAGNIGEHSTGLAPLRPNFNGLLPLPADGQFEWAGFVPNAALPHSYNPAAGFIATANQKTIPDHYPYAVGFQWSPPSRFDRIREVLESAKRAQHKLTVADMEALQLDVVSLVARDLQALLRQAVSAAPAGADAPTDLLLKWDCALRADSAAAALYELWTLQLREAVTRLAVPQAAQSAMPSWPLYQVALELLQPRPAVFGAAAPAARDALLHATLQAAYAQLRSRQGSDPARWSWGALHKAFFRHALDGAPDGAALLDRGPVERSGDGDVVQATEYDERSLEQTAGASYRQIFDLADWDNSVAINVPGQSGEPGSKHYDDLLPLWSAGQYFPLRYSRSAVDAVTTDVLILQP
ncbi:MAG: penicillin acylase family protein [Gammaproteobacteria bacterium]|nr:penicillin acylase family protein [Gammaproteobacteria bacterium]